MGQRQSQPQHQAPKPAMSEEERAQIQVEMRAKQQAALDKRLAREPKTTRPAGTPVQTGAGALEQASRENVAWRNIDAQAEFRNWN